MFLYMLIAICILTLSQGIGYWVNNNIELNTTVEFNSFIHFTHIRNYGGTFGLLQGMGWLFTLVNITILSAVTLYLWKAKTVNRYEFICFGFIVGGGASNILDRYLYGSVIDFIDVQHIPFWNYIFNTADVMVHVGIWPLLLFSIFADTKPEVLPPNTSL
jgi:signal peptidase II|tara:strand:+ start:2619 stop:3098 length:480 start_codon:yes stop_codon:yes gene_type:complete